MIFEEVVAFVVFGILTKLAIDYKNAQEDEQKNNKSNKTK